MGIVPGTDPGPREDPLLADEPLPPGVEDYSDDVDEMEKRLREGGSDEVQEADEAADAVEDGDGGGPGSSADAEQDPTSDEGVDAEDPEAQQGDGAETSTTD